MILSAPVLESRDRCHRQWAYTRAWEMIRVKPLEAVYLALGRALTATDYTGPQVARQAVMDLAGERGVWTDRGDPYDVMVHHAYLAEAIARVLRQPSDGPLERHKGVKIGGHAWQPESYLVGGGTKLMRVVLADHWDDDRQLAECHSWRTMGDVCVTGLPMTMRVVVIGGMRNGKRHGHWTKARQHPQNRGLRFQRKHDKADGFTASWKTVYRENCNVGVEAWVEQMARDGVLREVAFSVNVRVPGEYARKRVLEDIERIGDWMEENKEVDGGGLPMNRSACDSPIHGPCPLQCVCYAQMEIEPGDTGVFRRRT